MRLKKKKNLIKKTGLFLLVFFILLFACWIFLIESNNIKLLKTEVSVSKTVGISPNEEIVLSFSSKFLKNYYKNKIEIEPAVSFIEEYDGNKIILKAVDSWPMGEKLKINLPAGRNFAFLPIKERIFQISTLDYPKISYVYPFPGAQDVIIGIEDPIEVSFLDSTLGFNITIETNPAREMVIEKDEDNKKIKLLPKEPFPQGENVEIKIYASFGATNKGTAKKIFQGSFETLPSYPTEWPQDKDERLAEVKRFTQARIRTGKYIDVNLSAQVMSIFEDGKLKNSFLISSGKRGMDTPKGEYSIYNKFPRPWSSAYSLYMPYWMAITSSGKYGIHELPEWPGGYKEGANHLGIPVSHGCIRLGVGPAEEVYNWAEIGTPVIVY